LLDGPPVGGRRWSPGSGSRRWPTRRSKRRPTARANLRTHRAADVAAADRSRDGTSKPCRFRWGQAREGRPVDPPL